MSDTRPKLISDVDSLTRELKIEAWDVLLLGDGSGSGWKCGTGWACMLLDRASWAHRIFWGAANTGTVNRAELRPYIEAMDWYFCDEGPGVARVEALRLMRRPLAVHIVTDSQYVAVSGNNPGSRKAGREWWAAMDAFAQRGLAFTYHHWCRSEISLNILVDEVSRQARIACAKAYDNATQILANKYQGLPADARPEDFFFWQNRSPDSAAS